MEKYIYLFGCFLLLFIWLLIFLLRKDLRKKMSEISVFGGIFGPIAEFWYFSDYWRPPTLMGVAKVSLEDFLFGFAITGISASLYYFVFNKKQKYYINSVNLFKFIINLKLILLVVSIIFLMVFLNNLLKINSIFASSFIFIISSVYVILRRKDLVKVSVVSSFLLPLIILPIYHVILNLMISPSFFEKYWLLNNTVWGIKILGNIPVTELIWYFSAGAFLSILYEYVTD